MEKRKYSTSLRRALKLALNVKPKLSLLLVLMVIAVTNVSVAFTQDLEQSRDNIFQASTLDAGIDSNSENFDPNTPLTPGNSTQREIFVQNLGQLPFQYSQEFEYLSGDISLCNALALSVDYIYYDGASYQTINKYNASLSGFVWNVDGSDADFDHPNNNPYFNNSEYANDEQMLRYTVSLPAGADPALENLTCNFNIRVNAWQTNMSAYPQGFSDTEVLENTISSGIWYLPAPENLGYNLNNGSGDDYALPHPNTELGCDEATNINGVSHHWTAVTGNGSNIKYQRQYQTPSNSAWSGNEIYTNPYSNFRTFGGGVGTPGTYNSRVRAFYDDNSNNALDAGELSSDWSSNSCQITYDPTAPAAPIPSVTNSPTKSAAEAITNGGFESGLEGWVPNGDIAIVDKTDIYAQPHNGNYMARIGVTADNGKDLYENILSQEIPSGVRSVGFYYNFFTKEEPGVDDPGMMVFINNKQVQQVWASDLIDANQTCLDAYCTDWQYMNVYVGDVADATLSIAFYAGNTYDETGQSWLYIDDVSTSDIVANSDAIFELNISQDSGTEVKAWYDLGHGAVQGNIVPIKSELPDGGVVIYWSQDAAGNKSAEQKISVIFDDAAPEAINDLGLILEAPIKDLGTGEYELVFTAPADNNFSAVSEYEVRYATHIFDENSSWEALTLADFVGSFGTYEAPREAGKIDTLIVQNLLVGQQYYFAIKSKDAANNYSAISNIAVVNEGSQAVDLSDSPVVINEFLPNPIGNDPELLALNGEWVELYNNGDEAIDLANWYLEDASSHRVIISAANSFNNLNTSGLGDTVIPAAGYLVVYDNFYLNNDGDTISLYNNLDELIDSHVYTGTIRENKSIARQYEGIGMFIDPEPTPGRKNAMSLAELEPQVRLFKTDETHAQLSIFDGLYYDEANYLILYTRDSSTNAIKEALQNNVAPINATRVDVNNIYFGSCSSGGSCFDHADISDVSIQVELLKSDGSSKTLEYKLEGSW